MGCIIYECVTGKAPWSELNAPSPPKPSPPQQPSHQHKNHSFSNPGPSYPNNARDDHHDDSCRDTHILNNPSGSEASSGGEAGGGVGAMMPQGGMGALFQVCTYNNCVCEFICACMQSTDRPYKDACLRLRGTSGIRFAEYKQAVQRCLFEVARNIWYQIKWGSTAKDGYFEIRWIGCR